MEFLSTLQVGQRIRRGSLPAYSNGYPRCACHPNISMIGCAETGKWAPALAVFPELGVTIDTRK